MIVAEMPPVVQGPPDAPRCRHPADVV